MNDEELLAELRARSETAGADFRWLIDELIKRYRICKFELETKGGDSQNEECKPSERLCH